jgi:tight adherence protein B
MTLIVPALVFTAVMVAVLAVWRTGPRKDLASRIDRFTRSEAPAPAPTAAEGEATPPADFQILREQKYSNWALLDQMIARRSWAEKQAAELTRADLPLRVGEYLMLRWLCAAAGVVLVYAFVGNALLGAVAGGVGYFGPRVWVGMCQKRRSRQFDDQIVEAVQLLASTLKSGYSFLQGMEAVAREMKPPISVEFDRLIKEIGVGARSDEALLGLVERSRSEDLELVVTAIMIQRTVGGELAGILETIVKTVRERQRIKRDVQTLTAQQRWSGYIIGALPIVIMVTIGFLNPTYVQELLYTFHGRLMVGMAVLMEMVGFFLIRRIIAIEV